MTRRKDPKKVAAGRAGAAARKAKQDRLLEQARGSKETLRNEPGFVPMDTKPKLAADVPANSEADSKAASNWMPWIVGAAGLVGVLMVTRPVLAVPVTPAPAQKLATPTPQLKSTADPFYMK